MSYYGTKPKIKRRKGGRVDESDVRVTPTYWEIYSDGTYKETRPGTKSLRKGVKTDKRRGLG